MPLPFIPYFQTTRYRVQAMIDLAEIRPNEKAADLGSGDGRIVIALAQAGAQAVGYELDPKLVRLSEENIQNVILGTSETRTPESIQQLQSKQNTIDTAQARRTIPLILEKDFWQEDLSVYDIITIYPMPDIMEDLEKKLQNELKKGARVLLNYYTLPSWKFNKTKDHIYLYKK